MGSNRRIELPVPAAPETMRDDLIETLHGRPVPDPYRWLEDNENPAVKLWDRMQNERTRAVLDAVPGRAAFQSRVESYLATPAKWVPRKFGNNYFFMQRTGEEPQARLFVRERDGEPRILVDPNELSEAGEYSLDYFFPSHDGLIVAVGISAHGSENSSLYVVETATGRRLAEEIPNCRHSSLTWMPGGESFYYTRYPLPGEVPEDEMNYRVRVFHHRIGTPYQEDVLVYGVDSMRDLPHPMLTRDGRYLLMVVYRPDTHSSDLYVSDLHGDTGFIPVITGFNATFQPAVYDHLLYILTNHEADRYRLLRVDLDDFQHNRWEELIPEGDNVLSGVKVAGERLFLVFTRNACAEFTMYSLEGRFLRILPLPGLGTVYGLSGKAHEPELFFGYESFNEPASVYCYDIEKGVLTLEARRELPFNPSDYEIRQVWYASKDGTMVSMFVGHRKGLVKDGSHPATVTGYGGFNIAMSPYFSLEALIWMDMGGVFALPNLRGGSEYGEEWHKAGMLGNKQNVFDDFIGACEWLLDHGYTSRERLLIRGGSNGGLLVGAAMVQRPELFKAVICAVPVLDMLRYHRFLLAKLWMGEYGDPDNSEHFEFLYAYSPVHNIGGEAVYPPIMITTAESDTRVDAMHARKFAAGLQHVMGPDFPVLYWIEDKAGHGPGAPIQKTAQEMTDRFSFMCWQLGVPLA
ncbi:S9 family peptidase [bacterium]|nr:S9 family peptidase [candidate division CSSED10-310 bacterium]